MEKEKMETRASGEIRGTTEEGVITAYLTKFNTVDSYSSTFLPGSFKRTFEERGQKIKLLWDHRDLCGHVIEAKEDSYGPRVVAQLNLDTTVGRDAYAHLKAGDVTEMSFGFNVISDKMVKNVRNISEIRCLEVSPVLFPANENATIIDIRGEEDNEVADETGNLLTRAIHEYAKDDLESIAKNTSFTISELQRMAEGRILPLESRNKLSELPESIQDAHKEERNKTILALCDELRLGGLDIEETKKIEDLLKNKKLNSDVSEMVYGLSELRKQLVL